MTQSPKKNDNESDDSNLSEQRPATDRDIQTNAGLRDS